MRRHFVPIVVASCVALTGIAVPATTAAAAAPSPNITTRAVAPATIATGASNWRGRKLIHPVRGRTFYPTVLRWANLVSAIMVEHKIPKRNLTGILAQIQQESAGKPTAVNRWDSNAKRGTPSKGLLQIIAPTYRAYAKPGYRKLKFQTVPYTNIWASLNYVINRYGYKKFRLWSIGQNQGY